MNCMSEAVPWTIMGACKSKERKEQGRGCIESTPSDIAPEQAVSSSSGGEGPRASSSQVKEGALSNQTSHQSSPPMHSDISVPPPPPPPPPPLQASSDIIPKNEGNATEGHHRRVKSYFASTREKYVCVLVSSYFS